MGGGYVYHSVALLLTVLWMLSLLLYAPAICAKLSLLAFFPALQVFQYVEADSQLSLVLAGATSCIWVGLYLKYFSKSFIRRSIRYLGKAALFVLCPIVLAGLWENAASFSSIALFAFLLVLWICVFWYLYPSIFARLALYVGFPLLVLYSLYLSGDYFIWLAALGGSVWFTLLFAFSRRIALSALLKLVFPVVALVTAYRFSGVAAYVVVGVFAVVWLAIFAWFDIKNLTRVLLAAIIPAFILVVWHIASIKSEAVIPSINQVLDVFFHPLREPPNLDSRPFLTNIFISFLRVAAGFSLATITGVPIGILIGRWNIAKRIISPFIEMARPICPIAWLPVAIIVFGFSSIGTSIWGDYSYRYDTLDQIKYAMVFIIWWGAFFPIVVNTVAGVRGVRKLYIDAALVLGVEKKDLFFQVILPASLPSIVTGMRVGMGVAWMVIVAAEFFPGTSSGLGFMITTSHQVAQYEYAFASIIAIGSIGLVINRLMTTFGERASKWESLER